MRRPRGATTALVVLALLLSCAYVVVRWQAIASGVRGPLYDALDLDGEGNLPTYFSAACLARVAIHAWRLRAREAEDARRWMALALVFVWLSMDEALALHERVAARALVWTREGGVSPLLVWAGGAVLCVSLAAYFLPFVTQMPRALRRATIACAVVYVGGALGVETLGHAWARVHGWDNHAYTALVTIEETAEMLGAIAFGSVLARTAEG